MSGSLYMGFWTLQGWSAGQRYFDTDPNGLSPLACWEGIWVPGPEAGRAVAQLATRELSLHVLCSLHIYNVTVCYTNALNVCFWDLFGLSEMVKTTRSIGARVGAIRRLSRLSCACFDD